MRSATHPIGDINLRVLANCPYQKPIAESGALSLRSVPICYKPLLAFWRGTGRWHVAKGNYPAFNSCCSVGSDDRLYEYEEQVCGAAYQHDPHDEPRKNHS